MKKETEIKIKIDKRELPKINKILNEKCKATSKPKFFQRTYQFFSGDISCQKIFPRIRCEDKDTTTLTVKVKGEKKSKYFERREHTIEISNLAEAIEILKIFGFGKMIIWEKIRYSYYIPKMAVEVNIDETPMGWFLEIEGAKQRIQEMVGLLGFDKRPKINKAYLGLWEDYKKENKIKKQDMLFR